MEFWGRVEAARAGQATTYRWLAESILKKSETTISGWRSQDVLPRADDAVKIARALGTTVEYLVTGADPDSLTPRIRALAMDCARLPAPDLDEIEALVRIKVGRLADPVDEIADAVSMAAAEGLEMEFGARTPDLIRIPIHPADAGKSRAIRDMMDRAQSGRPHYDPMAEAVEADARAARPRPATVGMPPPPPPGIASQLQGMLARNPDVEPDRATVLQAKYRWTHGHELHIGDADIILTKFKGKLDPNARQELEAARRNDEALVESWRVAKGMPGRINEGRDDSAGFLAQVVPAREEELKNGTKGRA